jgi:L-serine dehydratase
MIGPVMIGPSSSHTAGVVRIGRVARRLMGDQPQEAVITFYNSFARTYEGHGSDRAILAGLMDMATDDERIRDAKNIATEAKLNYKFKAVNNASAMHPNTVRIIATSENQTIEVVGVSRGGGLISIIEIDGFKCNFTAQRHTLMVSAQDLKGTIAFVATVLSNDECNIATMTVDRKAKNQMARLVIEVDSAPRPLTIEYLRSVHWIDKVSYLPDIHI